MTLLLIMFLEQATGGSVGPRGLVFLSWFAGVGVATPTCNSPRPPSAFKAINHKPYLTGRGSFWAEALHGCGRDRWKRAEKIYFLPEKRNVVEVCCV